ncbi:hypothetical protein glysoja_024591 [Glycine soja]|uniref:Uncharacterized protein n=1 Tax=Glycine soja TaxID=3848 RepID=A0A0B2PM86_GLYSO|nr:hypothetical protein glysoja_024591 [Glycine soja]
MSINLLQHTSVFSVILILVLFVVCPHNSSLYSVIENSCSLNNSINLLFRSKLMSAKKMKKPKRKE